MRLLFALFCVALGLSAHAGTLAPWEPTWGAEITVTSKDQAESDEHGDDGIRPWSSQNQAAMERAYEAVKKHLRGRADVSQVRWHDSEDDDGDKWFNDYFEVIYKDGFRIKYTMDPYTIEVLPSPFTLKQFREKYKSRIQSDIFDVLLANGFVVRYEDRATQWHGGGHLNMGAKETFGDDVGLLRNWLVDQVNHSELAAGAMEHSPGNAKPYARMKKSQREAFVKLIEKADSGKFKHPRDLATEFAAKVLFEDKPATGKRIVSYKYWQMIMLRFADLDTWDTYGAKPQSKWTWPEYEAWVMYDEEMVPTKARVVEIRHLKAQRNAYELEKDIELFEGRLRYLKHAGPIAVSRDFIEGKVPDAREGARRFAQYIRESGQDPKDFFSRLPQNHHDTRDWRQWQESFARSCRTSLEKLQAHAKKTSAPGYR